MTPRFVHSPPDHRACPACGLPLQLRGVLDISPALSPAGGSTPQVEVRVACSRCRFVETLAYPLAPAKPWRPPPDPLLDRITSGVSASTHNHPDRSAVETAEFLARVWRHIHKQLVRASTPPKGHPHD